MFRRILVEGSLLVGFTLLVACSTTKTSELPPPPTPSAQAPVSKPDIPPKDQGLSESATRSKEGTSSLDALRRGEIASTPPGSPLKEVFFDFDSYDLSADARSTLKAAADWLKKNPAVKVNIEGHCDDRGTTEYNLALGAKRAQTAQNYLVSLGVPASRLSTISYGEEVPVCREENESCWQKNRRDRFVSLGVKPSIN